MSIASSLVVGVTGSFLSDGLQRGYRALTADDFRDCVDTAAEQTADNYGLSAGAFDSVFHSDLPGDDFDTFEDKIDRTPNRYFATRLQTATETKLDDPEEVVKAFFRNVELELVATHPDQGLRILLEYAHEFIDSEARRTEFKTAFDEEMAQLQDALEGAHGATRTHVSDEHEETRTRIETLRDELDAATGLLAEGQDVLPDGFERLSAVDFDEPKSIERCWRIGFDFPDIQAGHAFERRGRTDASTTVIEDVREKLLAGEDIVVLGRAGSGKSTTCKQVACRWHTHDDGAVFYYEADGDTTLAAVDGLRAAIESTDEECLIVVEDAIRPTANDIFDVLDEYWGDESVHFLLDARFEDWQRGDTLLDAPEARDLWGHELTEYQLPSLTSDECRMIIEHFQTETGESVRQSPSRIHDRLAETDGIGEMLLLAYYLVRATSDTQRVAAGTVNPLQIDVEETYDRLRNYDSDTGNDLALHVGIVVTVLKASRLGMETGFIYALGDNSTEYEAIETVLDECTGDLVFTDNGGYKTHHERWAVRFLEHVLDDCGARAAAEHFETCVNALFDLLDNQEQRDAIDAWSRGRLSFPDAMADDTQSFADTFVTNLFELGERRPPLAPLFGSSKYSKLTIPDVCSTTTDLQAINQRGTMYSKRGDYGTAKSEFSRIQQRIEEQPVLDDRDAKQCQSCVLGNLGLITQQRGEYEDAREYHEDSLELVRELGDIAGIATSLNNLGIVAGEQGEYEDAREYHEDSLELVRELGDTAGIANNLGNLGLVAREQGEYEDAREYHEDSLELVRELGDTAGIANNLGNLGQVAREQGEYEDARKYHEDSLELARELGNTVGIATNLNNLGLVAQKQGEYGAAREYFERAARQFNEVGAAVRAVTAFKNLVHASHRLGDVEDAIEACETALELIEHADAASVNEQRHVFDHLQTSLELTRDESLDGTRRLYRQALTAIHEQEYRTAGLLFRNLWERRTAVGERAETFDYVLAAGVGFAAHLVILDEAYPDYDQEDVFEEIASYRGRLSQPATALYDLLRDGDSDPSIDTSSIDTDSDIEALSLPEVEALAYDHLIGLLPAHESPSAEKEQDEA